MSKIFKEMPNFANVVAGGTANAELPIGLTYDMLGIRIKTAGSNATEAQMKSMIDEVRLSLNGKVIIQASGTELLDIIQYYGTVITDGVFPILFERPSMRTPNGEKVVALGTTGITSLTLEVDINAGATSPQLELYAQQSAPRETGQYIALRRFAKSASTSGELEISTLPKGDYGLVALHCTKGDITKVEIEANNRIVHQSDAEMRNFTAELRKKSPQSGYTHIDFLQSNMISEVLPLKLEDFRQRLTLATSGAFNILMERVETYRPV